MFGEVLSVTNLNEYIRGKMDSDPVLTNVAVQGEISNYKLYPSGHHYFTLKDDNASIKCVMFKGNAFRLRFRPENGMRIIALGRVSVYPRDGMYQLYCSAMTVDGLGDLHVAFNQLKEKLQAEGLFDPAHKKQIPKYPRTIGIVTSEAGAALHDMLRIISQRYPLAKVRLFPSRVQGIEAPEEISSAIDFANKYCLADVLIVGRGGGSIEDLWAFNDERVAYAIYRSAIPVISAVGHEPDFTISDFVADLRAATPSNAAELVVPDQATLRQYLDQLDDSMLGSINERLNMYRNRLELLSDSPALKHANQYYQRKRMELRTVWDRLYGAERRNLEASRLKLIRNSAALDAMSPLKVISRGYSYTTMDGGSPINSVSQVRKNDRICITMTDGKIIASVTNVERFDNEK